MKQFSKRTVIYNGTHKSCSKCGEILLLSKFSHDYSKKSTYKSECHDCANDANKRWRHNNLEHTRSLERDRHQRRNVKIKLGDRDAALVYIVNNICRISLKPHGLKVSLEERRKMANILYDRLMYSPVCPYTGVKLELRVNAHLDHILPQASYPELAYDLSNMQWVSPRANMMKNNMTHNEFIAFCHNIAQRFPIETIQQTYGIVQ